MRNTFYHSVFYPRPPYYFFRGNGRAPDDAPIKQKMLYASSKDAIIKKLNGVDKSLQGTDYDEIEFDYILKNVFKA